MDFEADALCDCSARGFAELSAELRGKLSGPPEVGHFCYSDAACDALCACKIEQAEGTELEACRQRLAEPSAWCYVDPAQDVGSADLVNDCPADRQRRLRIPSEVWTQTSGTTQRLWVTCGD